MVELQHQGIRLAAIDARMLAEDLSMAAARFSAIARLRRCTFAMYRSRFAA
jgi:hypothetical protein